MREREHGDGDGDRKKLGMKTSFVSGAKLASGRHGCFFVLGGHGTVCVEVFINTWSLDSINPHTYPSTTL